MSRWVKQLVIAGVIAVMPLQGIASVLTVLMCHGDSQIHATRAVDDHHHHEGADHQHDHGAAPGNESSTGDVSFHLCCNLAASVPPANTVETLLPDFPVRAALPAPLHDLFVPEQPPRPPLVLSPSHAAEPRVTRAPTARIARIAPVRRAATSTTRAT